MVQTTKLTLFLILFLVTISFLSSVNATITINQNVYFYISGEWKHFTTAHTFSNVYRDGSGVWYFDGKTFDEVEGHPSIPPDTRGYIISNFNAALVILGLVSIIFMVGLILYAFKSYGEFNLVMFILFMGFVIAIIVTVAIVNLIFVSLL